MTKSFLGFDNDGKEVTLHAAEANIPRFEDEDPVDDSGNSVFASSNNQPLDLDSIFTEGK